MRAQLGAAPIQATKLGDRLTMLSGPGGNVVILHGPQGKVVVDGFVKPAWPKLKEALDAIDSTPIKSLIDTHWHFDHADNNANFRDAGAGVIAHENTRKRLREPHDLIGMHFDPAPSAAMPTQVFPRVAEPAAERRVDGADARRSGAHRYRHLRPLRRDERAAHGRRLLQRHVSVHRRRHRRAHRRHDRRRREGAETGSTRRRRSSLDTGRSAIAPRFKPTGIPSRRFATASPSRRRRGRLSHRCRPRSRPRSTMPPGARA